MHVEPPLIPIIKVKHVDKSEKYFVKLKLCRYPTSATSDLYDFKMDLFDNVDLEEFLIQLLGIILIKISFNIATPIFSGRVALGNKAKYLLRSIKQVVYCLTFKPRGFLIPRHIARFCFDREFTRKKYKANPKII